MNNADDAYEKARDDAAHAFLCEDTDLNCDFSFKGGADWSRDYTLKEILESDEMRLVRKALDRITKPDPRPEPSFSIHQVEAYWSSHALDSENFAKKALTALDSLIKKVRGGGE